MTLNNLHIKTVKHAVCMLIACLTASSVTAQEQEGGPSHYLFPEFVPGVVLMKDGTRNDALLNYNALTEEMIFDLNDRKRALAENEFLLTDTVFIGDRKFVELHGKFAELAHHSTWDLLVEHKCKVVETGKPSGYGGTSQTSAATAVSSLYSQGRVVYNLKLPDGYQVSPYRIYWLNKNGETGKLASMRELKKFYADRKELYREYLKTNPVQFEDQESMIQFITYLESHP